MGEDDALGSPVGALKCKLAVLAAALSEVASIPVAANLGRRAEDAPRGAWLRPQGLEGASFFTKTLPTRRTGV